MLLDDTIDFVQEFRVAGSKEKGYEASDHHSRKIFFIQTIGMLTLIVVPISKPSPNQYADIADRVAPGKTSDCTRHGLTDNGRNRAQ